MKNEKIKNKINFIKSSKSGFFYTNDVIKLLESLLDEEEETKERYFKLIDEDDFLQEGKIYKGSFTEKRYSKNILYFATTHSNHEKYIEVSKEEYDKQELLEEAKRRYPAGTKFRGLLYNNILESTGKFQLDESGNIWTGGNYIYFNDKWAEKIEEVKEDFDFALYEKMKENQERKQLFSFKGHDYFEGDLYYWFVVNNFQIKIGKVTGKYIEVFQNDTDIESKLFPTEQLCKKALHEYIWENHKVTAKEFQKLQTDWNNLGFSTYFNQFYCETIIRQKAL